MPASWVGGGRAVSIPNGQASGRAGKKTWSAAAKAFADAFGVPEASSLAEALTDTYGGAIPQAIAHPKALTHS